MDGFLGEPPRHVLEFIKAKKDRQKWRKIIQNLENFSDSMIGTELPDLGSDIDVKYKIDADGDFVTTKFQVLGYNGSIPQFIKYKNDAEIIYVPATASDGGELSAVTANSTKAYTDKSFESTEKGTITDVNGEFTYGSTNQTWGTTETENGSFSVPTTVTVGGTDYTFAGYNMTIMSRYGLITSVDGTTYDSIYFSKNGSSPTSRWTTSEIRSWMNKSGTETSATWVHDPDWTMSTSVPGLLGRFDGNMLDAVSKAVNRTYVCGGSLDCAVDAFWLPGRGNINAFFDYEHYPDYQNDTCKFSVAFEDTNSSRIRQYMNETGGSGETACYWWLRSAFSNGGSLVGVVDRNGRADGSYASRDQYQAVLPACLIG